MIIKMYNILKLVKKYVSSAQEQAKFYVKKSRCPREFEVSDKMFLKVKPLKSQLRLGKCPKLSLYYCGPFAILKRISKVAYELDLPKE
jgi:hypothetical protein